MSSSLKVEKHGAVTVFTIDNAAKRNVLSQATALHLQQAFAEFDAADDQRVAVVTASGTEFFTAGADLADIPEFWRCTPGAGVRTDKPIIAAVAGWCVGGGITLVGMSDLAIAADNTRFMYPEAKIGLTQGLIASIAGRMPQKKAMEVMLLGRPFDAETAKAWGFINEVVPTGRHLETAMEWAQEISRHAPLVLRTLKRFVGEMLPESPSFQYARTLQQIDAIKDSEDLKEGMAAFREKRSPSFSGR